MDKCPCIDCPCIPVCMNRRYVEIIRTCSLWRNYVKYREDHTKNERSMSEHRAKFLIWYNILKPKRWFIHRDDPKYGFMIQVIPEGANRNDPKYNTL